jgi:hydroxymethylbilane synthase
MKSNRIVIGSRKSKLALFQSNFVKGLIERESPGTEVVIEPILTKGDKILDKPLAKIGDKGLFTEELEKAILSEEIDLAVHSLKDLPTELPSGLEISVYSKRAEPHDALICNKVNSFDDLPSGAVVGTSSLRRISQLLNLRSDLKIVDLRGNVETRVKKLKTENIDAILLAAAGLIRLEMSECITQLMQADVMLPAVGQGIIAVESKSGREDLKGLFREMNDPESQLVATAERALLNTFGGGCQVPIGAYAKVDGENLILDAYIGSVDGRIAIRKQISGQKNDAESLGEQLAHEMINAGGDKIISEIRYEK